MLPRRLFPLLMLLVAAPAASQTARADTSAIRRYVTEEMRRDRIPGAAVVVVSRQGIVYAQGFGRSGRGDERVTADTPFLLGSMSKSFTALAVMQLVEAGRIALDTPVVRYLPEFRLGSPGAERITVRHLLAHTSGIPERAPRAKGDSATLADHVAALREVRLRSEPGTRHEYASPNYEVLGLIVERVSGERFGSYLVRHVFLPLGMAHSAAGARGAAQVGVARGHQVMFGFAVPRDLPVEDGRLPTASLVASAGDIGRFLRAQLNGGISEGGRVLSAAGMAEMHRPQGQADGFGYGMGWRVSRIAGAPAVHHGGILPDFRGKMVILPEQGLALAVLTNVSSGLGAPSSHRMADNVAAILLGRTPATPRWSLGAIYLLLDALMLLVIAGQVWSLLRAWRSHRNMRRGMVDLVLASMVVVLLPRIAGIGWPALFQQVPDIAGFTLLAAGLGAIRGLVRLSRAPAETSLQFVDDSVETAGEAAGRY